MPQAMEPSGSEPASVTQMTLEQCGFEPHGSTYTWMFSNRVQYPKCILFSLYFSQIKLAYKVCALPFFI